MALDLSLHLATPRPAEEVIAALAADPDVLPGEEGGLYGDGLVHISVADLRPVRPGSLADYGFEPTVLVWCQPSLADGWGDDATLPGAKTFYRILGRLLAAFPGDATLTLNYNSVILVRRNGAVTLNDGYWPDADRARLNLPHRFHKFPRDGGPETLAAVDAP